MRKKISTIFFVLIATAQLQAQETQSQQTIRGFVYEVNTKGKKAPLVGAHVYCVRDKKGVLTDEEGAFELFIDHQQNHPICASFVGYLSDTIDLKKGQHAEFLLKPETLKEISLSGKRQKTNTKPLLTVKNIESITAGEIEKAACCNLSECFETTTSVDVGATDAITGTKQIQMLGLGGVYTQVLSENKPFLRGLLASYGLNYLPGSWIESIHIFKGAGSVVNGFESITGQINVEIIKPKTADKLFWNTYLNSFGVVENNFAISQDINDKWKTLFLGHYNYLGRVVDVNKDGFVDNPELNRVSFLSRTEYVGPKNRYALIGLRYIKEAKLAGQVTGDDPNTPEFDTSPPYQVEMDAEQAEANSKVGILFEKPGSGISLISSYRYNKQNIFFGESRYFGKQNSVYLNLIYKTLFGKAKHVFKSGASYYGDNYQEMLLLEPTEPGFYDRHDQTLGVFAEGELKIKEQFSSTFGVRADHSKQWGWWYSPRIHLRINPIETMAVRFSAGRAHRQANVFAENIAYFFSSRELVLHEEYKNLIAERAVNYGFNFIYNFSFLKRATSFNIDLYKTNFEDQVVVDIDSPTQVNIYNLEGVSSSTSLQIDASIEPHRGIEIRFSQKWNDTKTFYSTKSELIQSPFVPKHRGLAQVSYSSWQDNWSVNVTIQNTGPSRVPTQGAGEDKVDGFWSPTFQQLDCQVTRRLQNFECYLGAENLLNYMQPNPIRNIENPFGESFDASMIWGPVMGRLIYVGVRYRFNKK